MLANLTPCPCPALQNDHYYADSMQRFLDMLTRRMYGSSSNNTDKENEINEALAKLWRSPKMLQQATASPERSWK
jgi:hypothetical protein